MNKEELLAEVRKLELILNLGERHGDIDSNLADDVWHLIDCIKKLDEPQKPVVPYFVADCIEYYKRAGNSLGELLAHIEYEDLLKIKIKMLSEVVEWVYPDDFSDNEDRIDLIARAWLDGYEVEKEKLYIIKFAPSIYGTPTYGSIGTQNGKKIMQTVYGSQEGIIPNQYTRREIEEVDDKYMIFAEEVTE